MHAQRLVNCTYFRINFTSYFLKTLQTQRSQLKILNLTYYFFPKKIKNHFFLLPRKKLQTNTNLQTISLVSNVSKLFGKLTSRVSQSRVHCRNLSLSDLTFMLNSIIKESIFLTKQAKHNNQEIEFQRRRAKMKIYQRRQEQKRRRNKNNEASQVKNQRSNGGGDVRLNVVYLIGSVFVGLFLGLFFIWVWWVIFSPSSAVWVCS